MELFGVGVDNFQIVIVLCAGVLTQRNFVNFRLGIVIIVEWLERWRGVKVVDVSAWEAFRYVRSFECGEKFQLNLTSFEMGKKLTSVHNKHGENAQQVDNQTEKHFHDVARPLDQSNVEENSIIASV